MTPSREPAANPDPERSPRTRPTRHALAWLIDRCGLWLRSGGGPSGGAAGGSPPGHQIRGPRDHPARPVELDFGRDAEARRAVARLARLHNLEPLLFQLADGEPRPLAEIPPGLLQRWEEAYHHNVILQTELFGLLEGLLERAASSGLRVAVIKGPVTAVRGYGDPALRQMADVDLLCEPEALDTIAAAAGAAGFESARQTSDYHRALRHRSLGVGLELHFRLYDVIAEPRRLLPGLWDRLGSVAIEGIRLPALSRADAALVDVAHLVQHDLRLNLRPLLDLAATLRPGRIRDPELLDELLTRADLRREYDLIAALVSGELGWPAPVGATDAPPTRALHRRLRQQLERPESLLLPPPLSGPHFKPGMVATLRYLVRQLLPPPSRLAPPGGGAIAGLLRWPGHALAVARRGLVAWRTAVPDDGPSEASIKAGLYRRRTLD